MYITPRDRYTAFAWLSRAYLCSFLTVYSTFRSSSSSTVDTMPTATSILDSGLLNNGPLTTTFTAPASCSTAYNTGIAYADHLSYIDWSIDCKNHRPLDCDPPGPVITSVASAQDAGNPVAEDIILYHSPGFDCPSGWTTAGAATKINPTSSIVSGAFSINITAAIPSGFPFFQDTWPDELASTLDPSETAFACCPKYATRPSTRYL
jgi:hypothetical protein